MNRLLHLQCTKRYLRRSCTNSSLFMKNNNNIENKKRMPNYIFDKKSYNKKVLNNPINKHKQYHLPSLSIVNNCNCHQKRLFSKTTVKQKKSGGNDDNFDEQEMAQLLKSLEEDKETEELREMKFPGVQRGEKMVIIFTCTVCNTRTGKTISKLAYEEGVVIARCPGCESLHLVADRLNYFGDENWDIEKFLNERGDNIKLIDSDDKLLQIQMTDIVGSTSNKKKDDDGRQ